MIEANPTWVALIRSILDGHKYLSLGGSPVGAISEAFKMEKAGLIKMSNTSEVHGWKLVITEKGQAYTKQMPLTIYQ